MHLNKQLVMDVACTDEEYKAKVAQQGNPEIIQKENF